MKIIIIGNGGHSLVIRDMIASIGNYSVTAILDDRFTSKEEEKEIIYAPVGYLKQLITDEIKVIIAIGDNAVRKLVVKKINLTENHYLSIIHPTATVSNSASIGPGTVVMPHAIINAKAQIGWHCIVNTGAIVEHENMIGDYSHVSPNATLTGNVQIGEGVHIGAGATIIPGMTVGNWSVIGAGSTVIKHIPSNSKAVGSPTRILNYEQSNEKSNDKVVMLYDEG